MIKDGKYIGEELVLFEKAHRWKKYFAKFLAPYLRGNVLEVGAGIGGTTKSLCDGTQDKWICLEPDEALAAEIESRKRKGEIPAICEIRTVYSKDLDASEKFDAILYMDVIEHIEHDAAELEIARQHLNPGGALIILVPAHQFLFSPFDKKIGHFRRYSRSRLIEAVPSQLSKVAVRYLDSVGLFASVTNKLFLKSSMPSASQIQFWDNNLVPLSRWVDRLLLYGFGKSLLGVWRNPE